MELSEAKKIYDFQGYVRIPGVFTKDEMLRLSGEAYAVLMTDAGKAQTQWRGARPALMFGPADMSDYIKRVSRDRRLQDIVTSFLGPDTRQLNNQIYFREAGDGDEFGWHQDVCFRTPPERFSNIESNYLQTIICVDEMNPQNGAIEFIPGSHKWETNNNLVPRDNSERGLRTFNRGTWRGEKVKANPGDVLLWSVMTVHGSEKNTSTANRMNLMNGFCADSALVEKAAFPIYTKGGVCV